MKQPTLDHWLNPDSPLRYLYFEVHPLSVIMSGPFREQFPIPSVSVAYSTLSSASQEESPAKRHKQQFQPSLHLWFGGRFLLRPPNTLERLRTQNFSAKKEIYLRGSYGYLESDDNDQKYLAIELETNLIVGNMRLNEEWLEYIGVAERYHRRGIGANLIRMAVLRYGRSFKLPCRGVFREHKYYLSVEGAALAKSCVRQRIVMQEQCEHKVPQEGCDYASSSPSSGFEQEYQYAMLDSD